MDQKKNKIIVGAVVGIALLSMILLVVVWTRAAKCELSEHEPVASSAKVLKTKGDVLPVMAKLSSYLIYNVDPKSKDAKKVYMPLEGASVSIDSEAVTKLTISTNCSTMALWLSPNKDGKGRTVLDSIHVDLVTANEKGVKSCLVSETEQIYAEQGTHYACNQRQELKCMETDKDGKATTTQIATLVFNELEFEFQGIDSEKFKKGEFTTKTTECKKA